MGMEKHLWVSGMLLLLLIVVGLGCEKSEKEVAERVRAAERQRELEQKVEEQTQEIIQQGHIIDKQNATITILWITIPLVLFVGTLIGLKAINDAKRDQQTDKREYKNGK